ncbi:NADH:flavin oxidoreductase/NADH oxidase [Cellulomonas sp. SG140]|uniref:NADH:flavin oxidoreductase/NADH oxidase n=1 Tax=Cellulomonas sp. SG140 TaxID=2976536 RepID=UPI0021E993EA|nr:NADH:flavin oxidoreductase/NADH oxidase [Cellulomonas sp. SG140]
MSLLFEPLTLRGTTVRNRAWLSPMCQYSAVDGVPNDWHLVHLGARAAGGFGLVLTEATAVTPEGRISPQDTGLWNEQQTTAWARITDVIHARGAVAGVQLAHAGRKASTFRPFHEGRGSVPVPDGGWGTVAPSGVEFPGYEAPRGLSDDEVAAIPAAFAAAARRALDAGFDVAEVHAAHGYLLHQFLSPLSNQRTDRWGGSLENRVRLLHQVVDAVREVWPDEQPVVVRLSATDWTDGGLTVDDVAEVAAGLAGRGVDLIDVSTGGNVPAQIPVGPGYQVPAARRIREVSGLPVSAVGLISAAVQAEQVLVEGSADAVMIARAALRDPSWALHAAAELGVALPTLEHVGADARVAPGQPTGWPVQYERAVRS